MKKLTRKLFLSVAALAVCAATLVSTTFAWYVSNQEASVSGVTGSTAGSEVSGNLLVAEDLDGVAGSFTQNLVLSLDAAKLYPATKGTGENEGKWLGKDGKEFAEQGAISHYTFSFWVMSTKEQTVDASYTMTNTTIADNVKKQKCYNATGAPVAKDQLFVVDAIQAMRMNIVTTEVAAQNKTLAPTSTAPKPVDGVTYATFNDVTQTSDANIYYKQLLGVAPYGCTEATGASPAAPEDTWTEIALPADTPVKVTVTIWLEGTDKDCFDSCINQTFDLKFNFDAAGSGDEPGNGQ